MIQAAAPHVLPVWTVFKRSYVYAWERRDVLGLPYLIYALVTTVVDLGLDRATGGSKSGTVAALAIDQVFGIAFTVAIQRFVLLGEAGHGAAFFRWDRYFASYLLNALLLFLAAMLSLIFLFGLFENVGLMMGVVEPETFRPIPSPKTSLLSLLALAIMIGLATILSRLLLTLPAAALGVPDRLKTVWAATTGNGLRLLGALLLVLLPFITIQLVLVQAAIDPQGAMMTTGTVPILVEIALGLIAPIQLIVFAIMLALDYDALVRGGGPPGSVR